MSVLKTLLRLFLFVYKDTQMQFANIELQLDHKKVSIRRNAYVFQQEIFGLYIETVRI